MTEVAIADGALDPFTGAWKDEETRIKYTNGPCPISDSEFSFWSGLNISDRTALRSRAERLGVELIDVIREEMKGNGLH
jgi:hypothetical protein